MNVKNAPTGTESVAEIAKLPIPQVRNPCLFLYTRYWEFFGDQPDPLIFHQDNARRFNFSSPKSSFEVFQHYQTGAMALQALFQTLTGSVKSNQRTHGGMRVSEVSVWSFIGVAGDFLVTR